MSINSETIKLSVKLRNEDYLRLREAGYKRRESHQQIAERAIRAELKKLGSSKSKAS